mmetsp:Transcript_22360/g.72552  ORF Transcript_22360/g.72552 Transcript_22360/m.72552 type:complete len:442 (+) Transcript_22360:571-1896(+)
MMVSTLEEVSLHQQDIEKIENLGFYCKHLKILYLQNNLISRIENVNKLKELEYLNLAVNNVTKIENLQRCESLQKLDLTVNFVEKQGLLSMHSLEANYQLRDLFLMGNPCSDFEGYRDFVIATVPSLKRLDGKEIPPSERIKAKQNFAEIEARLVRELEAEGVDVEAARKVLDARDLPEEEEELEREVERLKLVDEDSRPWSAATRVLEHRELAEEREKADNQKRDQTSKLALGDMSRGKAKPRRTGFDPLPDDPELAYQKNEGNWKFSLLESEDGRSMVLDVGVSRFLDTSLIDVDVTPRVVRMLIKGKLLQLRLDEENEVHADQVKAQRSKATGAMQLIMPKVKCTDATTLEARRAQTKEAEARKDGAGRTGASKGLGGIQAGSLAGIVAGKENGGAANGDVIREVEKVPEAKVVAAAADDDSDEEPPMLDEGKTLCLG